jgi:hypothetical protein
MANFDGDVTNAGVEGSQAGLRARYEEIRSYLKIDR